MARWSKPFELLAQALTIFGESFGAFGLNDWFGRAFFVLGGVILGWSVREFYISFTSGVSPQRIPILNLRDEAGKSGWNFTDAASLHIIDFADALRQAGRDGALKFWGRPRSVQFDDIVKSKPLVAFEPEFWEAYELNYGNLAEITDNFQTRAYVISHNNELQYVDIHVQKENSTRWLRKDAAGHRGRKQPPPAR